MTSERKRRFPSGFRLTVSTGDEPGIVSLMKKGGVSNTILKILDIYI